MSEVLVVSKTKMGGGYFCVGGIDLRTKAPIRLMTATGHYQPPTTPFDVGDIWDLTYIAATNPEPPHTENVHVQSQNKLRTTANLVQFIQQNCQVWRGGTNTLFGGILSSTRPGKGYISRSGQFPNQSTGFWMPAKDLILEDEGDTYKYNGVWFGLRRFKYVGVVDPIARIPANTVLRVSLARWWKPENSEDEERCYLQLSGWYF